MKEKLERVLAYIAARAAEPGTWQGVAFILTLTGSRYASLDWGQCAALGAMASAVIKIFFPDALKNPSDVDSGAMQASAAKIVSPTNQPEGVLK